MVLCLVFFGVSNCSLCFGEQTSETKMGRITKPVFPKGGVYSKPATRDQIKSRPVTVAEFDEAVDKAIETYDEAVSDWEMIQKSVNVEKKPLIVTGETSRTLNLDNGSWYELYFLSETLPTTGTLIWLFYDKTKLPTRTVRLEFEARSITQIRMREPNTQSGYMFLYRDGNIHSITQFRDGAAIGTIIDWNNDGTLREIYYAKDPIIPIR